MPDAREEDMNSVADAPRWRLESVYPGFDSAEYRAAKAELAGLSGRELAHVASAPRPPSGAPGEAAPAGDAAYLASVREWLVAMIDLLDRSDSLFETLVSYCYARYSSDTTAKEAMGELNSVEELGVPFSKIRSLYLNALASNDDAVRALAAADPALEPYRYALEDDLFWQTRQMSAAEEDLAADLARSGASAWGRLQEQMTSTADCLWDETTGERKTLVELRSLAHSLDRAVRAKAFRLELETCRNICIPVAAALNGVKGTTIALNGRRHWDGPASAAAIGKSVKQGLLTEKALDALVSVMEESLPHWRRYLKAKARLLGVPACSFSDLFAPVGRDGGTRPFARARETVVETFSRFSPRLGAFATKAFDGGWIDAEIRPGKIGGAYFTYMPDAREGRVLCNYDGTFNSTLTLAHELGHAYHAETLKDQPAMLRSHPMTLAETASIFAETVVFESEAARAKDDEKLAFLELRLQDGCQILVDILSRFYFERAVFEARKSGELSPADFCALMEDAQRKTYGDGIAEGEYHPYMWLVKTHYYSCDLAFYNFPYAFGQLFALGLYDRFRSEGPSFAETYDGILVDTGRMDAVRVTARAGFDIETPEFWRRGVSLFLEQIDEFERLVAARVAGAGR